MEIRRDKLIASTKIIKHNIKRYKKGRSLLISTAIWLQILQSTVVLFLSPLYAGVMTKAEAIVQSKKGPSVFQPYFDLAKLLRKGTTCATQSSAILQVAPFVAFSCYLTVSVIVPIITNAPLPLAFLGDLLGGALVLSLAGFAISLAGIDAGSHLGSLGASRATWVGSLAEPTLILVFFGVGVLSASDNPYLMNHAIASSGYIMTLPGHLLGTVAFFMLVITENGKIPIDNPSGTIEISMIEESRTVEFSGRGYAIAKWGSWMKLFLLSAIFMNVFVLPWGLGNGHSVLGGLIGTVALLGKLAICGVGIVIIDSSFAKLRFFRITEFLGAAFLLALLGIIASYVIGH